MHIISVFFFLPDNSCNSILKKTDQNNFYLLKLSTVSLLSLPIKTMQFSFLSELGRTYSRHSFHIHSYPFFFPKLLLQLLALHHSTGTFPTSKQAFIIHTIAQLHTFLPFSAHFFYPRKLSPFIHPK